MPKKAKPLYANVAIMDGRRVYTSFDTDLDLMIRQTEWKLGVIAIEEAHQGKPPVWERGK